MPGTSKHCTILLAEDETLLRELAEIILTQAGYRVVSAPGAEKLRSIVVEYPENIDLLLTDVVMPGVSGQQLANLARERWPQVRVLYMSGYASEEIENMDRNAAFLQKPFTPAELMQKIQEVLGR